jgi:alkylation response protein AidB-like acyl-CoA dehydrogenase
MVLVPLEQQGVSRTVESSIDQSRACATLRFESAKSEPIEAARGWGSIETVLAPAVLATAFEQLGGAQACLEMACRYALHRTAFGQPIGRFQAIKHKLAEMYCRIEVARGCATDALDAMDRADAMMLGLCSAARLAATDAYEFAAQETIQTHGGLGVTWEALPHHHYRRSRVLALELGAKGYWRERLLAQTGLDPQAQSAAMAGAR